MKEETNWTRSAARVVQEVFDERQRQQQLVREGKLPFNCADRDIPHQRKLPVLVEEVGEVAKEVYDVDRGTVPFASKRLREELIQVAAVAVAWLESLEDVTKTSPPLAQDDDAAAEYRRSEERALGSNWRRR